MMHRSLPARLRVLRARRGLTLIDAAEKIGIGRDTLSDLERGNRHPVMPTLAKIAEGYGVPVEALLEEESVPLGKDSQGEAAEQGADPLDGWIGRALSEGDFARDFERAKGSQELADELHRAKIAESDERHQVWETLRKNDAPPAAILEARRDLVVSNAQLTAAAFLAVERWRGHEVSGMDPRSIVADVLRNQRALLAGGDEMEPTAQSGESA